VCQSGILETDGTEPVSKNSMGEHEIVLIYITFARSPAKTAFLAKYLLGGLSS
jgi:hypothetical protein